MPTGEVDQTFLDEIWALYAVGMAVLILRFVVRFKSVGMRGMQGDDFFALLVALFYTLDAATVHIVYYAGTNVEASVVQATRALTEEEIAQYEYGSKIELVAWYSYTALIWCLKGTMLCFFKRMTTGLWQHRLVKWLMWACVASYIAVFLTITFGCFPTQKNWQVTPDPGLKCTFKMQNFLVSVVLNVITDGAILCIPLPLLWTLQVPIKKKVMIGLLLCSGLFVITAAIIRVVLTLGSHPSALNVNRWGVRETIVGIITVNIPILRPMFSKTFWRTGQVTSPTGSGNTNTGGRNGTLATGHGPYEMASSIGGVSRDRKDSFGGSEECIIGKNSKAVKPGENDVVVQTMYHVTSEDVAPSQAGRDWDAHGGHTKAVAYGGSNAV
ncbi:hypothetical protein BKA67DRAFT_379552 [Truncatella angustata]|uniref:Rhodopsin domain-containing protein n=1 Tax=Truncatella angustata TaxID=152316 RepID=A0A9P8UFH6_9PEZI|nr:uncharacterized protein BKA67DRAFT_379552 [Truncatella angustata]KAH6649021.1 hypothetical protein BKA67DRAFT_379552 [Truncatella angustata]KAH8201771.1 hypothetical protein TruAng_004035 [Truncatella angustata]